MKYTDIILDAKEVERITQYEKDYGKAWVDKGIQQSQANKYIKLFLKDFEAPHYGRPYNCCNTGWHKYVRIDGNSITQDDIDALKALDNGQENYVIGKAGDLFAIYEYMCDSSG